MSLNIKGLWVDWLLGIKLEVLSDEKLILVILVFCIVKVYGLVIRLLEKCRLFVVEIGNISVF